MEEKEFLKPGNEYEFSYDYKTNICKISTEDPLLIKNIAQLIKSEKNEKDGFINKINNNVYKAKNSKEMVWYKGQIIFPNNLKKYFSLRGKYIESCDIFLGVFVDDTSCFEIREKLIHAEKMRSLGALAGGIAHDFNNQLMVILGSCELIEKNTSSEQILNYVKNIKLGSQKSSELINKLLIFGNADQIPKTQFNVVECVNDMVSILNLTTSKKIKILYDVYIPDIPIYGNYGLMQNAILNLCKNSIEAFDTEGVLMLKINAKYLKELPKFSITNPMFKEGLYAEIQITDNACGIQKDLIKKVFDPFFTTKGFNSSAGLGLSTVLGTIDLHDGILTLKSIPKKGSVFSIYIKLSNEVIKMENNNSKKEIMIVDDEYLVRMVLRDILLDLGYDVKCFETGREAIDYYRSNNNKVSLVICDMMMPVMTGKDVFYALKEINPLVKFIVLSGYSSENDDEFNNGIISYQRKPVMFNEMRDVVVKALK